MSLKPQKHETDAVKGWLKTYPEKLNDIRNMQAQLERIEDKLSSVGTSTLSDMPKAPSKAADKEAELIVQKIDLEREIEQEQVNVHKLRLEIEKVMSRLKKSNERAVIRARYLCEEEWTDISFILFGAKADFTDKEESYLRRVHYIHKDALEALVNLIPAETLQEFAEETEDRK